MRSLTLLYRKKTKNEKVGEMKKTIILRIFVGILALCLCILALTIAYFFNTDIQTKEPRQVSADCEIHTYTYMERNIFTVTKKNAEEIGNQKYIVYFHGGSYVAEATQNHWDFLEDIVKDTGYTVIMPDYPLTPKYNYQDVYNMVEPLYKEIIETVGNENVILMGDSAGGGLALGLYEKMAEEAVALPSKTILISPWLDVKLENENIREIEKRDTILNKETLRLAGIAYAGNDGINSYLVNPIEGDASTFQNVKIFIGTKDILNPDCHLLKEKADQVNGEVEIKEYENAKHIWIIDHNSEEEVTKQAYNDVIEELKN